MKTLIALSAAVLGLGACSPKDTEPLPQGSTVAAAMPDTDAKRADNPQMTAPDAGATGAVPADGGEPRVGATPAQGVPAPAASEK